MTSEKSTVGKGGRWLLEARCQLLEVGCWLIEVAVSNTVSVSHTATDASDDHTMESEWRWCSSAQRTHL